MSDAESQDARIETVLSQLSHAANQGVAPEELLTRAIDGLVRVTRASAGIACLINPEGTALEIISARGIRPQAARTLPETLDVSAAKGTRPIPFGKEGVPELEGLRVRLGAEGLSRGTVIPLGSAGRPAGLLIAMFRTGMEPGPVPLPDLVLENFGRQLSIALQNARIRQSLQSVNTDLLKLLTLAKILGEPRELEDTLTTVAQAAKSLSGAVATVVWLSDAAAKRLTRIVLLEPEGASRFPRRQLAFGEGLAGWVAETGEALYVHDVLNDPRLIAKDWARDRGIRTAYSFPLRFKDESVGVLSLWTAEPLPAPQLSLLGIYSDHAALAIGHARLVRDKEAQAEQFSDLLAVARTVNEGKGAGEMLRLISVACRRAVGAPWVSVWRADNRARELRLIHADPAGHGLSGNPKRLRYGSGLPGWTAVHRKARVSEDCQADLPGQDPAWYRNLGIGATVALPLLVGKNLLGVLHLGAPGPLGAEQLRLVEGYATLVATALARPAGKTRK